MQKFYSSFDKISSKPTVFIVRLNLPTSIQQNAILVGPGHRSTKRFHFVTRFIACLAYENSDAACMRLPLFHPPFTCLQYSPLLGNRRSRR